MKYDILQLSMPSIQTIKKLQKTSNFPSMRPQKTCMKRFFIILLSVLMLLSLLPASLAEGGSGSDPFADITHTHCYHRQHNQRNGHRKRSLVRCVVLVGFLVLCTPEDTVVQTEHVEGCHSSDTRHDPTYHGAVCKAGGDDLILRAKAREEGDTSDGQTRDEERDVGHRHILAQTSHQRHLVGVDSVDDTSGTEEQTSLEHSVGEQMEHTSHITQLCVVVENAMMTRQTNAQCHHHKGNLRNG